MENNNTQEERILKYIKGQMDGDERLAFEKECEMDSSLSDEVEYHKEIAAAVFNDAASREYSMRELLLKTEKEILSEREKVIKVDFGPIREPLREAALYGDDADVDARDWLKRESSKMVLPPAASKGRFLSPILLSIIIVLIILVIALLLG